MEPCLALDAPIDVDLEESGSNTEEDSGDERLIQALAALKRNSEQQLQLVEQAAGSGASGAQTAPVAQGTAWCVCRKVQV